MDRFLNEQKAGEVVGGKNEFTVDRATSREKLLQSIPKDSSSAALRLIDASIWNWGFAPSETFFKNYRYVDTQEHIFVVKLDSATVQMKSALLQELRLPFGEHSGASLMARAIFRATQVWSTVKIDFNPKASILSTFQRLVLLGGSFENTEPTKLDDSEGLNIHFHPLQDVGAFEPHRLSPAGRIHKHLNTAELLLPLEAATSEVGGFFEYRTKPFTAIRSYVTVPEQSEEPGMLFDLWDGPYSKLDSRTVWLDTQKPGKFLFLRWRPDYGRPTFLHHNLDSDFQFGPQKCRATFWIESTDRPATDQFFCDGVVSDPVSVQGPVGLSGLVIWPGLTFDIWGTQLVHNDEFEDARNWAQTQVNSTAECLKENIEKVVERIQNSNLLKTHYVEEIIAKIKVFWG